MKILLVEDSATIRHAMCTYIRAAGHEAVVAESGEEALQILENTPVEMIIMDVEMPGLDGFETTHLIREWLGDHWVPIIFVTGKSEDASFERGIAAGGDDYLIKPISQIILNAKIRAMERITAMRNQLSQLNHELTILSQRDGLTQLYNRRTFEEKADEQWRLSARTKQPLTLLLLDIDYFKLYNDCYGHQAGDECIRQVAATLAECLNRPSDIVARYGGEEFIALLPDTPERGAGFVAEHIRAAIEALAVKHRASKAHTVVTVSIGGSALHYTTGTSMQQQIALADKALYEAKKQGRNRCVIHEFSPGCKILVVDDSETTLECVSHNLQGHCTMLTATGGDECLEVARECRPDVILLDVMMPGLNGYEVCDRLKRDPLTVAIPVILISSCELAELQTRGAEVKADAVLTKPLETNQLIASIDRFLQ